MHYNFIAASPSLYEISILYIEKLQFKHIELVYFRKWEIHFENIRAGLYPNVCIYFLIMLVENIE